MSQQLITVGLKSTFLSKINLVQLLAVVAMLLASFGVNLDAETQAQIVSVIVGIQAIATWIIKTYFTTTITPRSASRANLL